MGQSPHVTDPFAVAVQFTIALHPPLLESQGSTVKIKNINKYQIKYETKNYIETNHKRCRQCLW